MKVEDAIEMAFYFGVLVGLVLPMLIEWLARLLLRLLG